MRDDSIHRLFEYEDNYWWFKVTRDFLDNYLQSLDRSRSIKILEIGCGTGGNLSLLASFGEIYNLDLNLKALTYCHQRGFSRASCQDVQNLAFKKETFDLVVGMHIIEHVGDDYKALEEIKQVLKPRAKLILAFPAYSLFWSYHDLALKHKRRYNPYKFIKTLKQDGFKISAGTHYSLFLLPLIVAFRLFMSLTKKSSHEDVYSIPTFLNSILYFLAKIEYYVSKVIPIPFGLSFICMLEKNEK